MLPALVLTLGFLLYRLLFLLAGAPVPWENFSPLAAICLCTGAYARNRRDVVWPLAGLAVSDVVLNAHYHVTLLDTRMLPGYFCFLALFALGRVVRGVPRHRVPWLLGASAAGSILYYLVTNTFDWWFDGPAPYALTPYAHNLAGWWQALTIGHPGFPPTLFFLRNSLASDLLFTVLFVATQTVFSPVSRIPVASPVRTPNLPDI
ncbi:MAG TPA: DUF6580 family putative transport protein [Chthoniobacterales bacterium]